MKEGLGHRRELYALFAAYSLPVLLGFTVWWLMRSIPSLIDCQISQSGTEHSAHLGFPVHAETENSLPKGAGRPQWLQLMICGKYLMLARWSGDILDAQPWIMDPFRDAVQTEVSKALNGSQVTPQDLSKWGHNSGLNIPAALETLKDKHPGLYR